MSLLLPLTPLFCACLLPSPLVICRCQRFGCDPPALISACVPSSLPLFPCNSQLGLGVFASGPLLQAQLLKNAQLAGALAAVPALQRVEGAAPRLLQFARSTPGLLTALVGHKAPEHVRQNCALSKEPPLSEAEFRAAAAALGVGA